MLPVYFEVLYGFPTFLQGFGLRGPKLVYLLGLYKGSTTCEVSILKRYGNLVGGS